MVRNILKLCLLLSLPVSMGVNAGVDCDGMVHTRLETSICGAPALRALDKELSEAFEQARQKKLIEKSAILAQRNQIARRCWREPDPVLERCLISAELRALQSVAVKLGEIKASAPYAANGLANGRAKGKAKTRRHQRDLPTVGELLGKQLSVAQSRMRFTGDPELTIATMLGLLKHHEEAVSSGVTLNSRVAARNAAQRLRQRLATGCSHAKYGRKWRAILAAKKLSCDVLRRTPVVYSSSDYE